MATLTAPVRVVDDQAILCQGDGVSRDRDVSGGACFQFASIFDPNLARIDLYGTSHSSANIKKGPIG